jgi:hypothetical protein
VYIASGRNQLCGAHASRDGKISTRLHSRYNHALDDIPIKGCLASNRNNKERPNGVREFVWSHLKDVEKILKRLMEVGLTLSGEKTSFGMSEILVVGQLCSAGGRVPNREKVEVIGQNSFRGKTIFGCLCILCNLDSPFFHYGRAIL